MTTRRRCGRRPVRHEGDRLRRRPGRLQHRPLPGGRRQRRHRDRPASAELIQKIGDSLDIRAIVGFASHPEVLEQAGAADAEMLIAVTYADEVNMVACQVAHSLFNVPTKIARVRQQSYLRAAGAICSGREHMPIDVIISPELEVARAVSGGSRCPARSTSSRSPTAGAADRRALRRRLPGPRHAAAPADLPVPRPAPDLRRHRPRRPLVRARAGRPDASPATRSTSSSRPPRRAARCAAFGHEEPDRAARI